MNLTLFYRAIVHMSEATMHLPADIGTCFIPTFIFIPPSFVHCISPLLILYLWNIEPRIIEFGFSEIASGAI